MNDLLFNSIHGRVGYGNIGLAGALGYDQRKCFSAPDYRDWECISAHGPSQVRLDSCVPLEIVGSLDGTTGRLFHDDPVRFYVDDLSVGHCIGPWDVTPAIVIPPGKHVLDIRLEGRADRCHSVWFCRAAKRGLATADNTVLLSVDTFGPRSRYSSLMRRTAAKNGIKIVFLDEEMPWKGSYDHKIERMIPRLREFEKSGKQFVIIVDSRDVVFVDSLPLMLGKFNAINEGKIVCNTEALGTAFPFGQGCFQDDYYRMAGHFQAVLNTAVLAGPIKTFLEVMSICQKMRKDLMEGRPWSGFMKRFYREQADKGCDREQYLYQLCQMCHPQYFAPDIEKRFCAQLTDIPQTGHGNNVDVRDGRSPGSASVFHIPDWAENDHWKEWVAHEGKIPELKLQYLTIGDRRPGYGNIGIGRKLGVEDKTVAVPGLLDSDETIGAHADSHLEIRVKEKILIAGGFNETAVNPNGSNHVEYLIDEERIGTLNKAGTMTTFVPVYPGKHTLAIRSLGSNTSCHSLWIVRKE